jgi:uncharacterized membrane protein YoaK (UPF0700 family)
MEQQNSIGNFTLFLAIVAGFCDTLTFVTSQEFSAHVTGNFIVFAYDIIKGADSSSWIKLVSFPVFVVAVITGGWIISKTSNKRAVLLTEGIILTLAGCIMALLKFQHVDSVWLEYGIVMPVVFAMGLQNAFGKLFSKDTYGPTTMMTGNVTQAALDLWQIIKSKFGDDVVLKSIKNQSYTIGGFLSGCLLGALAGEMFGLSAVLLPGIALIMYPKKTFSNT